MKVGIADADLIGRKKHRFPNLACMKISSYHKKKGDDVILVENYDNLDFYDRVYISKVFTDTKIPENVLELGNVVYGGTGFYYDKAPRLDDEIEHSMPDYHLYDKWVEKQIQAGKGNKRDFCYYTDYSIGFLTRGCFRQCEFCVNKNYKKCTAHSQIDEFYDQSRPKLCFLDDNFFACPQWEDIIQTVKRLNKPFQFKQGLDERLLTDDKIKELAEWKYDGDIIFAFDNILDREIIEAKLNRIFELYPNWTKHLKFYVFCGYDRNDVWNEEFWQKDIRDTFERIRILSKYSALPYIMRYASAYESEWHGVYSTIAGWCNQPSIFKKFSYEEYCKCKGMGNLYSRYKRDYESYLADGNKKGAAWRYYEKLILSDPALDNEYCKFVPENIAEHGCDASTKKREVTT